jgi:CYTH domain-containing protein
MSHKYAQIELERRWLLDVLPDSLQNSQEYQLIEDRYITRTPLRLRRMTQANGQVTARKLTQKYQADDQTAYATTITNFYLDEASYALLETLPAQILVKKRFKLVNGRFQFSIDQFQGPLNGLVLAEIEQPDMASLLAIPHPAFARREVTEDPRFTGGELVGITAVQFVQLHQNWLHSY